MIVEIAIGIVVGVVALYALRMLLELIVALIDG